MRQQIIQPLLWTAILVSLAAAGLIGVITTEAHLAPWDSVASEYRPAAGTWQATLNLFFERGPGSYVFSVLMTGFSLYMTLQISRRRWQRLLQVLIGNLLMIGLLVIQPMVYHPLNNLIFGDLYGLQYAERVAAYGYARSVIPFGMFLVTVVVWLAWQRRLMHTASSPQQIRKQKRKRHPTATRSQSAAQHLEAPRISDNNLTTGKMKHSSG